MAALGVATTSQPDLIASVVEMASSVHVAEKGEPCASALVLLRHYAECCRLFRVRKTNSALLQLLHSKALIESGVSPLKKPLPILRAPRRSRRRSGGAGEVSKAAAATDAPPDADPVIREIDTSKNYLGPRGLMALFALCGRCTSLEKLDLTHARWFGCDNRRQAAPSGNDVLKAMCQVLQFHPSLRVLVLNENEFTTSSYLCLVEFIKNSPMLEELHVEDTFLDGEQKDHLASLLEVNARRKLNRSATLSSEGIPLMPSSIPANADLTPSNSRSARAPKSVKHAVANATSTHVVKSAAAIFSNMLHADKPDEATARPAMVGINASTTTLQEFLTARKVLSPLIVGGGPFSNRFNVPARREKTPAELAEIRMALDLNGALGLLSREDQEKRLIPEMRLAVYDKNDFIVEAGDHVDYVFLLTSGGAIASRSDDLSMELPVGAMIGEEELLTTHANEARRYSIKAVPDTPPIPFLAHRKSQRFTIPPLPLPPQPAADGYTRAWLIPRAVFMSELLRPLKQHRRSYTVFIELLPALQGLGSISRLSLVDAFREAAYQHHDVICAGGKMFEKMFFVVEGQVIVYFQGSEVKRLMRGEFFACTNNTDVARMSVVASDKKVVLAEVAAERFAVLPHHVQAHLLKQAKPYSLLDMNGGEDDDNVDVQ